MFRIRRVDYIVSFVLIFFSNWYLSSPFSPVYFSFVFAILFSLYYIPFENKNINLSNIDLFIIAYCIFLIVQQLLLSVKFTDSLVFIMSLSYFFILKIYLNKVYLIDILKIYKKYILFTVLLFSVEAMFRYIFPDVGMFENVSADIIQEKQIGFYIYKTNSFMFLDSNFVALAILPVLCCLMEISRKLKINNNWYIYILIMLLLLTISRGAILGFIIGYIFLYNKNFYIKTTFIIAASMSIIHYVLDDGSGQSKIHLYNKFIGYLESSSLFDLVVGHGFGSAIKFLNMGAHSSIITLTIETGLIGLFFYMLLNFYIFIKYKNLRFTILSYQIASLSLMTSAQTPYFTSLILIIILTRKSYETENT